MTSFPNSLSYKCTSETQPLYNDVYTKEMHVFSNRRSLLSLIKYQGLNKFFRRDIASVVGIPEMLQFTSIFLPSTEISPVRLCIILNNIWQYNFGKGTCSNLFFFLFSKTEITSIIFPYAHRLHYFLFFTI